MSSDPPAGSADQVSRDGVDIRWVENVLADLRWRLKPDGEIGEAAEHEAAEARASVLNLVAVARTSAEQAHVAEVLGHLSVHHPSRTLILLAQQERTNLKLDATVSAQASPVSGHRISAEQVFLHAHGPVAEHLASVVAPLLIPDLPVMLWWPGRPEFESQLFNDLADLCDRLIVDTDVLDPATDFAALIQVARRRRGSCAIGDFNWARLLAWRELAAQFFDPEPMRRWFSAMRGGTVCSGGEGTSAQGRLVAGWLQRRLAAAGVDVPASLQHDPEPEPGLVKVTMDAEERGEMARFTISRKPEGRLMTEVRIGDQEYPGRMVRLPPKDEATLLAMELVLPGHDRVYEDALAAAARLRTDAPPAS